LPLPQGNVIAFRSSDASANPLTLYRYSRRLRDVWFHWLIAQKNAEEEYNLGEACLVANSEGSISQMGRAGQDAYVPAYGPYAIL